MVAAIIGSGLITNRFMFLGFIPKFNICFIEVSLILSVKSYKSPYPITCI